jgi:hypothetical protein
VATMRRRVSALVPCIAFPRSVGTAQSSDSIACLGGAAQGVRCLQRRQIRSLVCGP